MSYIYICIILIANNTNINKKLIDSIKINESDLIVLFNRQTCLKFDKIKNHKNKVLFIRRHSTGYHGINEHNKYKGLYKDIYYVCKFYITSDFENKNILYDLDKDLVKKFNDNNKSPQTGFNVYNYYKTIYQNTNNKIYLIGFTNTYSNPLCSGHSKELEQSFYKNELLLHNNLVKINI